MQNLPKAVVVPADHFRFSWTHDDEQRVYYRFRKVCAPMATLPERGKIAEFFQKRVAGQKVGGPILSDAIALAVARGYQSLSLSRAAFSHSRRSLPFGMGLSDGGVNNVKKLCKDYFSTTYREYGSLMETRQGLKKTSSQTVVILDGNVLMQAVPNAIFSLSGYIDLFERNINNAFAAGDTVIVVFDEKVTRAKQAEQERRDAARKKSQPIMSEDLQDEFCPTNDDYTREQIEGITNIHNLMAHRKARGRLFDIIVRDVLKRFEAKKQTSIKSKTGGSEDRLLIFDGVDERGDDRPTNAPRITDVLASDHRFNSWLHRREGEKVGEGDLKLSELQTKIEQIKAQGKAFKDVDLVLLITIDTDVIATELVRIALDKYKDFTPTFDTAFVFHERTIISKKRKAEEPEAVAPPATFCCFHSASLYDGFCTALFGNAFKDMKAVAPHAILLLVSMFVLGHSDFVALKGMRSEVSLDSMANICDESVPTLQLMTPMLSAMAKGRFATPDEVKKASVAAEQAIERCIEVCVDILRATPRLGRAVSNASARMPEHAKRATWVLLYWSMFPETALDLDDFGFDKMI